MPSNRLDLRFLILAVFLLMCGITLGIVMGIRQDFELAPVHAHANLVGWVSMALFGLTYRAYPQLADRKLATVHFWLAASAAVLFPIGLVFAVLRNQPGLAIVGASLWWLACLVFLIQLVSLVKVRGTSAAQPAE